MTSTWHTGQVLDIVRSLPAGSVDLVATSPPFLALRDYNGIPGQWGNEPTPAAFLDHQLELAIELRRVLAPHGTIAVELGDTFAGSGGGGGDYLPGRMRDGQVSFAGSARAHNAAHWRQKAAAKEAWPAPKSLCGTPTLYAWSLAYGRNLLGGIELEPWLVRNIIVWARNNPPVGALADKVRPATSYITIACPSASRWFDLDAVRSKPAAHTLRYPRNAEHYSNAGYAPESRGDGGRIGSNGGNPAGAPPLDYWTDEYDGDVAWLINTHGSSLAHFAMWPARLAERLILAMCPRDVCRSCGTPRRRLTVTTNALGHAVSRRSHANGADPREARRGLPDINTAPAAAERVTIGWSDCGCGAGWRPGVVLDPFAGTGTTLHAAEIHGRDAIGIDLDPANVALIERRRDEVRRALLGVRPELPGQLALEVS